MRSDRGAQPTMTTSAEIIDLAGHRRREPDSGPPALVAELRRATSDLVERSAALDRHAQSLAACLDGFEQIGRRLASEGVRARAVAAEAGRIGAAIDAGDLDALRALLEEAVRLRAGTG
jgi:hypothetical protein